MQRHTKIYMEHFGFTTADFVPCEICENKAVDIHHIEARGMGGDPKGEKDVVENLMALCREHHNEYGDIMEFKSHLKRIHQLRMKNK